LYDRNAYLRRVMHWDVFWRIFREQVATTGWVEWAAIVFGVAEVLLARVNNILLYPAGIISTAATIYILLVPHLYADSALNAYYLVMSIYGWWHWSRQKDAPPLPITRTARKEWGITAAIALGGFVVIYFVLKNYTDSTVPAADAWVTSTAWAGTWLLTRRKIENWLVLNVSNLFAVPLYFYKDLPMYAVFTAFLFIIAVFGYFDWLKRYKLQRA
jgi:nicotinamide mononucleotide transporter